MKEIFKEQLETNAPFSEGALMFEKRYHSGRKAVVGDIPVFAILIDEAKETRVMEMFHIDELDGYEVVEGDKEPPLLKIKL